MPTLTCGIPPGGFNTTRRYTHLRGTRRSAATSATVRRRLMGSAPTPIPRRYAAVGKPEIQDCPIYTVAVRPSALLNLSMLSCESSSDPDRYFRSFDTLPVSFNPPEVTHRPGISTGTSPFFTMDIRPQQPSHRKTRRLGHNQCSAGNGIPANFHMAGKKDRA